MPTTICLINQKGGCGKSSTCFHLAGAFAASGLSVLLIDADPQGSLSQGFFGSSFVEALEPASCLTSLFDDDSFFKPFDSLVRRTKFENIALAPTNHSLSKFNTPTPEDAGMDQFLIREFTERQDDIDIVLIDCPPNLYRCSWTAMIAADFVLIPVPPEDFGTQGLRAVHQAIHNARLVNPGLRRLGHLITRSDGRLLVHRSYEARLRDLYAEMVMDMVLPDPKQPRTEFSVEAIQHLAESIRTKGQFHPIRVRWSDDHNKWVIISGERRWRATQAAGLTTIDCFFQNGALTPSEVLEQSLVENLLREDLKPMEQAQAFSDLMDLNMWNGKQVAEALNISTSKVSRALALLDLPKDVQQRINDGQLAARSAYELSKLPNGLAQRDLAKKAAERGLTHAEAKSAVNQRTGKPAPKKRGFRQSFFADNGIRIIASAPKKVSYDDVEIALNHALEEVRHYINQGRTVL